MFDGFTMVLCELSLIAGGAVALVIFIQAFGDGSIYAKPNKVKKETLAPPTPFVTKEKAEVASEPEPAEPAPAPVTTTAPKFESKSGGVDISARIPNKDMTWSDITCDVDGKNTTDYIRHNRSKEDGAYSILERRIEHSQDK